MDRKLAVKRWQDWGNLLLGAWLFISPWIMQYPAGVPNAARNAHLLGAAIVIFSAVAVYIPRVWEEGINMLLGVWMIISPWALKFAFDRNVTSNAVIVGVLVMALAAWAMVHDKKFQQWTRDHPATPR